MKSKYPKLAPDKIESLSMCEVFVFEQTAAKFPIVLTPNCQVIKCQTPNQNNTKWQSNP